MTFLSFLIWISITLILYILHYNFKRRGLVKFAESIPGPTGWPLVGMLPRFYGKTNEEILTEILEIVDSYNNIARFWLGNKLLVIFTNLDYVKIILNSEKCLDKAFAYQFLSVDLGLIASKCKFLWLIVRK